MCQLLIVDDEMYAVEGIKSGVEWDKLHISSVHTAYNIRQAKDIFESHSIDIMICDIEMPQGNGLELLTWVREKHPATESIFLTCHADFDFAKKALQLGSLDYMLKPARFDELEAAVQKAIDKIGKNREITSYKEKYQHYLQLWSVYEPLVIERFWNDLLNQTIPSDPQKIKQIIIQKNIPYKETAHFLPILITVHRWHEELSARDEKIMEFALRDVAGSLIVKENKKGQIIQVKEGIMLAALQVDNGPVQDMHRVRKDCQAYIEYCSQMLFCDLSCYIGEPAFIHDMFHAFESLVAYKNDNVCCMNQVFLLTERTFTNVSIQLPDMNGWSDLLKQGCKKQLLAEADEYLQSLRQTKGLNASCLRKFYHNFLQMTYYVLKLKGLQAHHIFSEGVSPEEVTRSVSRLQEWVRDVTEKTVDYIETAEKKQSVVDKVKAYITQHINEELSREDIANHVFLNPDYLTRLFKKETGLSISDYLIQERVKIAKELLMKTDMSVKDIALEVGYSNFSHFSKVFKKVTDMNPKDFRQVQQLT